MKLPNINKKEVKMKTKQMLTILCLLITAWSSGQTIYSTETGGQWQDNSTWVGGVVPTSGNDVVIDGMVVVLNYDNKCNNIQINQGDFLGGTTGYYGQLTVFGDLNNNGGIGGGASFDIHGDITNNGTWSNPQFNINLKGTSQTITCAEDCPIGSKLNATDSTQNIYLGSNLKLIIDGDNSCQLGNAELFTQGHNLTIEEGHLYNVRITTNDTLTFINTILETVTVNGNYTLKGTIYAFQNNVFKGTATNLEGIINLPGYSTVLTFEGDLINYGSIQHSEVHLYHHATNYGTWYNQLTKFMGSDQKIIMNSAGHPFDGVQIIINNADAVVKCAANTEISPDHFFLGEGELDCNGFILEANTVFHNGTISNADHIVLHGFYENVILVGSTHLYGTNNMMFSTINGTFLNHDTITAAYPQAGNVLSVYGHFMNEGDYYSLSMDLFGDLTNHGNLFSNSLLQVKGEEPQFIYISNHISTEVRFLAMLSGTSYQWMKDGEDITGQQSDMMIFSTLELSDAGVYKCRVEVGGNTVYSREITVNLISGSDEPDELFTNGFILKQNIPNPFRQSTRISWQTTVACRQTVIVYDMFGKEVTTLVDEYRPAGIYEVDFNINTIQNTGCGTSASGSGSSCGVFFCQLKADSIIQTKKMIIIR
jgi:hypothetical protein